VKKIDAATIAAVMGELGRRKSEKKAAASRLNGKLYGGRPKGSKNRPKAKNP